MSPCIGFRFYTESLLRYKIHKIVGNRSRDGQTDRRNTYSMQCDQAYQDYDDDCSHVLTLIKLIHKMCSVLA